jgi:hypothetical protein
MHPVSRITSVLALLAPTRRYKSDSRPPPPRFGRWLAVSAHAPRATNSASAWTASPSLRQRNAEVPRGSVGLLGSIKEMLPRSGSATGSINPYLLGCAGSVPNCPRRSSRASASRAPALQKLTPTRRSVGERVVAGSRRVCGKERVRHGLGIAVTSVPAASNHSPAGLPAPPNLANLGPIGIAIARRQDQPSTKPPLRSAWIPFRARRRPQALQVTALEAGPWWALRSQRSCSGDLDYAFGPFLGETSGCKTRAGAVLR